MNKTYEFKLDPWDSDFFFKPLRKKEDVLKVLMRSMRFMIVSNSIDVAGKGERMVLRVSKMSRLFFHSENKVFSISFPFHVHAHNGEFKFISAKYGEIDSVAIANVLEILDKEILFSQACISDFADSVLDLCALKPNFWGFLKELLFIESGYIRFDHDQLRARNLMHPLNHIDVFYSSNVTFKLGLNEKIDLDVFGDILDLESNCHFLSSSKIG